MTGYSIYPSPELRRLRSEFPTHLICELHDEHGRSLFTATLLRRCCPHSPDLVTAKTPADLRAALALHRSGAR